MPAAGTTHRVARVVRDEAGEEGIATVIWIIVRFRSGVMAPREVEGGGYRGAVVAMVVTRRRLLVDDVCGCCCCCCIAALAADRRERRRRECDEEDGDGADEQEGREVGEVLEKQ